MDYRAAATRQLKDSNATSNSATAAAAPTATPTPTPQQPKTNKSNSASVSGSGRSTPTPAANASSSGATTGDLNKMKANSGVWSSANSAVKKPAAATSTTAASVAAAPMSYAATAAAKKTLVGSSSAGSGSGSAAGGAGERGMGRRSGSGRAAPAQSLSSLVNAQVRVTLVNDATIEGSVFTYDVYSGVVALISDNSVSNGIGQPAGQQQQHTSDSPSVGGGAQKQQAARIHLIKAANIRDLEVTAKSGTLALPEIRPVNMAAVEARKKRSLMQAQERASRIGVGVTDVAQSIFEALSRTLPCRWDQSKIVVLDEVVIESPYSVDNCREISQAPVTLQRVKKVLQGELNRIAAAVASN
ncbi:hypothetical protein H4R99_004205 [Coemansia sp. RSA 1722]|nr:hypothetical protein LPJ57_003782 [Coemansia sp. RSA 486]KAJ2598205.1 hypothetical protein H4R99_004205 [Coemansia sp. RSA 1722]